MAYTIKIEGGPEFQAAPGESILSAALRSNVGFPYDCSSGGCGSCKFELRSGELSNFWEEAPGLNERDRRKKKSLACQCSAVSDLCISVRVGDEYLPPITPQKQIATLAAIRNVTHDMYEVTLTTEEKASFLPGQYALIATPGLNRPRVYSMSNQPNADGQWKFIIRRVPGGTFSDKHLLTSEIGSKFFLDGPYGMAWYRKQSPRKVLCIAGGSGLAPTVSIASAAAADGKECHLFFGARTSKDTLSNQMLEHIGLANLPIQAVQAISTPEDDWCGQTGFIHEVVKEQLGDRIKNFEIYLAGPPPMIEALQDLLFLQLGISVDQVHQDRFF